MARWWRVATLVRSNLPPSIQSESVQGMGMIEDSLAKFPVCRFMTRLWTSNRLETLRVVQSKVMIAAFHLVNLYFSHIKSCATGYPLQVDFKVTLNVTFHYKRNCSSVNNNLSRNLPPREIRLLCSVFNVSNFLFLLTLPIVNKLNSIIYFSLITF